MMNLLVTFLQRRQQGLLLHRPPVTCWKVWTHAMFTVSVLNLAGWGLSGLNSGLKRWLLEKSIIMLHSLFFLTPCPTPLHRPRPFTYPFTQRGHCIFFLSSLPLYSSQLPRQCLGPICHLSTLNYHCIGGAGLPNYSIWWERFRGTQKEDDCGPLMMCCPIPPLPLRSPLQAALLPTLYGSMTFTRLEENSSMVKLLYHTSFKKQKGNLYGWVTIKCKTTIPNPCV